MKNTQSNTSILHRLFCAIFNTYPFSIQDNNKYFYRNGTWDEFQNEQLNNLRNTKISSESLITIIASFCSIVSLIIGLIAYFVPQVNIESKAIFIPLFLIFAFSSTSLLIVILLIWNDKKNYCRYYEQILINNHDILQKKIKDIINLLGINNSILKEGMHSLAEEYRIFMHYFNPNNQNNFKGLNSLQKYLDSLCKITSQFFIKYSDEIGADNLSKYSCCIKLINPSHLYNDVNIDEIQIKTLIRSKHPIDDVYNRRLNTYAKKYDQKFDKISENTDFDSILRERRWFYYLPNFVKKVEDRQYKTSHHDGYEYYKSAVSFPIIYRINDEKSILLGYICFDNIAEHAFPSCSEKKTTLESDVGEWEGFCCSQIDYLSIAIANYLKIDINNKFNKNLAIGPLKKSKDVN